MKLLRCSKKCLISSIKAQTLWKAQEGLHFQIEIQAALNLCKALPMC